MRKLLLLSLLIPSQIFAQKSDFKVIAYYTPSSPVSEIPFSLLSHINYSFAIPAKSGDSLLPIEDDNILKQLVTQAHEKNVKVFISIGGWGIGDGGGNDSRFHRMAETVEGRNRFVKSTMNLVQKYQLDGVDLDWEYPDPDDRSANDFLTLVKDLSYQLHTKKLQLTAAVVSAGKQAFGIKEEVYPYMDWLNIMAYDGDYGPKEIVHHSPYSMAVKCLDFWINERNLSPEKCVLGLPFYAKKGHGNFGFSYKELLKNGASPYDDYWMGHFYNGMLTIANKTKMAINKHCNGVMVWELALDTNDEFSLFKTISHTIKVEKQKP